jgi:hypothetical protein
MDCGHPLTFGLSLISAAKRLEETTEFSHVADLG